MSDFTEQQIKFAEVFLEESRTNNNYTDVAKKAKEVAGYAEGYSISAIMKGVKDLIIEGANLRLAQMIPKMLNGLEEVADNPATPGAKNKVAVAMTLLDRAGVIKKEESTINIKTPDGILVLPAKQMVTE